MLHISCPFIFGKSDTKKGDKEFLRWFISSPSIKPFASSHKLHFFLISKERKRNDLFDFQNIFCSLLCFANVFYAFLNFLIRKFPRRQAKINKYSPQRKFVAETSRKWTVKRANKENFSCLKLQTQKHIILAAVKFYAWWTCLNVRGRFLTCIDFKFKWSWQKRLQNFPPKKTPSLSRTQWL